MGSTWDDLLNHLVEVRDAEYRTEPERHEAIRRCMIFVVQTMLEKLRDERMD